MLSKSIDTSNAPGAPTPLPTSGDQWVNIPPEQFVNPSSSFCEKLVLKRIFKTRENKTAAKFYDLKKIPFEGTARLMYPEKSSNFSARIFHIHEKLKKMGDRVS